MGHCLVIAKRNKNFGHFCSLYGNVVMKYEAVDQPIFSNKSFTEWIMFYNRAKHLLLTVHWLEGGGEHSSRVDCGQQCIAFWLVLVSLHTKHYTTDIITLPGNLKNVPWYNMSKRLFPLQLKILHEHLLLNIISNCSLIFCKMYCFILYSYPV